MKKIFLILILIISASIPALAREIEVSGTVTYVGTKEPAQFVRIRVYTGTESELDDDVDRSKVKFTDESGNFLIVVDSEDKLIFDNQCKETIVDVNGRNVIDLTVRRQPRMMEELVVVGKAGNMSLMSEPADLVIEGDWLKWKQKGAAFKIPKNFLKPSSRIVAQPVFIDVTDNKVFYREPIVVDGWRYVTTQERMYDWHLERDTLRLSPKAQTRTDSFNIETPVYIKDSINVVELGIKKHRFACALLYQAEDYNKVFWEKSMQVGDGSKDPFRFLNYNLEPRLLEPLTDPDEQRYIPTPTRKPRDTPGNMNLTFGNGKADLDLTLGENAAQFDALIDQFKSIFNSRNKRLKRFEIYGYSSPEGVYASNKQLANRRMNSAVNYVKSRIKEIDGGTLNDVDFRPNADVAPWTEVVEALRADSLLEQADQIAAIIDRYTSMDQQYQAIRNLPYYNSLLKEKYLPRLRRVNYLIVTEEFRELTDDEIEEIFATNPESMSRYEFYRFYNNHEGEEREKGLKKAVEIYPDFIAAATDYSYELLKKGENPREILEPFFKDVSTWKSNHPEAMRYNMALSRMKDEMYASADSLLSTVKDGPLTHKAIIYCIALNGRYTSVMDEICQDSPLNAVLMQLKLQNYDNAAILADDLGDTAVEKYVKAITLHMLEDAENYDDLAVEYLEDAIRLDPSLKNIAQIDGYLVDLIESEDYGIDLDRLAEEGQRAIEEAKAAEAAKALEEASKASEEADNGETTEGESSEQTTEGDNSQKAEVE